MEAAADHALLCDTDPVPVEILNRESEVPVLLLCEHAGRKIPRSLGDLQVNEDVLISHRAWDIGAEDVALGVSERLNAPLILQRYSRLVIDANRPPGGTDSMPEISDGVVVPGNQGLTSADKQRRIDEIFAPMNGAIEQYLELGVKACFSIHSFTPRMNGIDRPWHAGFLTRQAQDTAQTLMRSISRQQPSLELAINEPYQIEDETDWFIPHYAEARGLPHCLIEIRNDQIDHVSGAQLWAGCLAKAISEFMETLS
ncbi:N-formylglutamate amidohydrolase [Ruegeria hyattellae]|uniref:N-formylglutamate amidohydrolase n=1 Tax=Ruegeria hyattellae TaxID=3233337 RepID=UPI00355C39F1